LATKKNNQLSEEARFEKLKAIANDLGVEFSTKIGFETLEKRVDTAKNEKKKARTAPPRKLSDAQVAAMKAKSLSKVKITNLDKDNTSTTVFSGVHNDGGLDLSRVVPLNMEIALEEALIQDIEGRRMLVSTPILNGMGQKTGNFKVIEAPSYAVSRLK